MFVTWFITFNSIWN